MSIWSALSTEQIAPLGKGYAIGRFLDKLSHLTLLARTYFYGHFVQTLIVGVEWWCVQKRLEFLPTFVWPAEWSGRHGTCLVLVRASGSLLLQMAAAVWLQKHQQPSSFIPFPKWMGCYKDFSPFFAAVRVTSFSDYEVLSGSKACVKHQYWQQDYCGLSWLLTCRPLKTL